MAEAIVYCDRCGRMINPAEFRSGRAVVGPTMAVCPSCAEALSPEERAALRTAGAPRPRATPAARGGGSARLDATQPRDSARKSARFAEAEQQPRSSKGVLVIGGVLVGLLAGAAAAVLLVGKPKPAVKRPPLPGGVPPVASAPVAPVAPAWGGAEAPAPQAQEAAAAPAEELSPARKRLIAIRAMLDPSLTRYDEIRRELEAFLKEFASTPEAAEANSLLAEIDSRRLSAGDRAFWEASESAYALTAQRKFDEAASVLRSLRERADLAGWLRERGESRIETLLKRIEASRAAEAERVRSRERETARRALLASLKEAGSKGVAEVRALLEREKTRFNELSLTEEASRLAAHVRDAQAVEELILDGLRNAAGLVRVQWQGRPYSGKVAGIAGGVLSLKPVVGQQLDIPLAEVSPEELVQASGIAKLGTVPAVKIARYLFVRGDIEGARRLARDATGEGAQALRDDIEWYSSALAPASAPAAEEEVAAPVAVAQAAAEIAPPAASDHPLDTDPALVGYWSFDEGSGTSARDRSGRGADAILKGALWAEGRFGSGLQVGGGTYAEVSDSENLARLLEGDYTIAAWFRPESTPTGTGNANDAAYGIVIRTGWHSGLHYNSDGRFVAEYWLLTPDRDVYVSSKPFPPGTYYHLAAVVNRAEGTHKLYVNGVLEGTGTFDPNATPRSYRGIPWRIGIASPGATQFAWPAKGIVDEVRLYSRALRAEEVSGLARYEVKAAPTRLASAARAQQGLVGEYFEGTDRNPDKLKLRRVDPTIDFDWGGGSPAPELPADKFSVRWTGELRVPADGRYEFTVKRDNGFALWVDGRPVIQKLDGGFGTETGSVELKAGWVPIRAEYYEDGGDASVRLAWSGPGVSGVLPPENLRAAAEPTAVASATSGQQVKEPAAAVPSEEWPKEPLPGESGLPGQWAPGLICEVFQGDGFRTRYAARIDRCVDFLFGHASPDLKDFSGPYKIRWSGWLLVPFDGSYSFELESGEESIAMALGGRPLVNVPKGKGRSQELELKAGLHPITVTLDASKRWWALAVLRWQPAGSSLVPVPEEFLFHEVPQLGQLGPAAKTVQGLWAEYFADENFGKKVAEGPVESLDLFYGTLPPCQLVARGRFSMKIRGYLLVFQDKEYGFELTSDGPAKLVIGGTVVADNLSGRGPTSLTTTQKLERGLRELELDYVHKAGDARVKVRWGMWEPNNLGDLGKNFLFRKVSKARLVDRAGLAPGLFGNLFPGEKPGATRAIQARYDPAAFFTWGDRPPVQNLPGKAFSGAWNGMLLVPESGQYAFRVKLQGSLQLAVGGKPLINRTESKEDWSDATMALSAGKVPISLTYSLKEGRSIMELYWSGPTFGLKKLGGDALAHAAKRLPIAEPLKEPEQEVAAKAGGAAAPAVPAAPGEKPPEKPPEGNLVANGSFEEQDQDGRFAARWTAHQWGPANAAHIVRIDRGNARTGDKALLVQAQADGALPGAFTTLTASLPPAKYQVRFWACADVGKSATVQANLAGRDAGSATVGEDWKQVSFTVELTEKKIGANLRIWSSTPRVRVWFDDVEVEAAK